MLCPTGRLLSDDDVCNIVQACYRIGHQSGKESALLRNLSRHILREIVHAVFRRLPHLREASAAAAEGVHHIEGKTPSTPKARSSAAARVGTGGGEVGAEAAAVAAVAEMGPGAVPASPTKGAAAAAATAAAVAANPIESAAPDDSTSPRGGGGVGPSKPHGEPFGLACVLEIFRFSVSFISLEDGTDENAESMCAFGLQLVLASLESAGEDFERHAPLLALVQDDLSRAVLAVAPAGHPPVLAATAATVLQLYMVMPLELKLQLEAFLRMVLLPLGEGRGEIPQESQRIALECIVDLCRQPNFVPDLYINFDCDLERPNLFEELTALLSRNAFPVNCPLNATHLLSLEGLLAVVAGIADRSTTAAPTGDDDDDAKAGPALDAIPAAYVDIWGGAAAGGAGAGGAEGEAGSRAGAVSIAETTSGVVRANHLRRNRHLKRRLLACADHFNRSYKKGLAYMQEMKLLPEPLEANAVARFLKFTPLLDKEVVGEYLGDHKEFNISTLTAYCHIFDFSGVTLDRALRSFLDGFKLPGTLNPKP